MTKGVGRRFSTVFDRGRGGVSGWDVGLIALILVVARDGRSGMGRGVGAGI